MSVPVIDYYSPGAQPTRPPFTALERVLSIALGVLRPVICFVVAEYECPVEPEWQSGEWNRYIRFVPDGRAGFPFYPLLIYCMAALCVFVARPQSSRRLAVRFGLYTGVVLALQYGLIQATVYDLVGPPMARLIRLHPLLADFAFATLEPVECVMFALLTAVVSEVHLQVRGLHGDAKKE